MNESLTECEPKTSYTRIRMSGFEVLSDAQEAVWHLCGFVCHMLSSDKAMTYDEVYSACRKYAEQYREVPETGIDVKFKLTLLCEYGFVKKERGIRR